MRQCRVAARPQHSLACYHVCWKRARSGQKRPKTVGEMHESTLFRGCVERTLSPKWEKPGTSALSRPAAAQACGLLAPGGAGAATSLV